MATDKSLLGNQVSTMVDLNPLQASCPLQEPHPVTQDEANEMALGTTNPPASGHVTHHHHPIPRDVDDNKIDPEHPPPDNMPMETNPGIDEIEFGRLPSFPKTFLHQTSGPKTCYEDNSLTIADDIPNAQITPPKSL